MRTRGSYEKIDEKTREIMRGVSMPDGADVSFDSLRRLSVPHHDFNGGVSVGRLVAARELADELLDIFAELFDLGYPIEKMRLIDDYAPFRTAEPDSLDEASMADNNTSAFCYRAISGTARLSRHALGRAVDLNPKINPWVRGERVSPENGVKYVLRTGAGLNENERRALIRHGDPVWTAFTSRGWVWGGDWEAGPDYQHFEK